MLQLPDDFLSRKSSFAVSGMNERKLIGQRSGEHDPV
jgi:hypothetical protein